MEDATAIMSLDLERVSQLIVDEKLHAIRGLRGALVICLPSILNHIGSNAT
ncbi:MAG TPA: hypothetical protein VN643_26750 [Pyrinomonadaceae bacterium]|nr:hypothetical protein [Pyrinomonadaceae bacterium]